MEVCLNCKRECEFIKDDDGGLVCKTCGRKNTRQFYFEDGLRMNLMDAVELHEMPEPPETL